MNTETPAHKQIGTQSPSTRGNFGLATPGPERGPTRRQCGGDRRAFCPSGRWMPSISTWTCSSRSSRLDEQVDYQGLAGARCHGSARSVGFDFRRGRREPPADGAAGFIEDAWIGRTVHIGDEVQLGVTGPCPRCSRVLMLYRCKSALIPTDSTASDVEKRCATTDYESK
jgi:hypothetical protein